MAFVRVFNAVEDTVPCACNHAARGGARPTQSAFHLCLSVAKIGLDGSQFRGGSSATRSRLFVLIAGNPPHGSVAILGKQQGAVVSHRHPDRPAPDTALVYYEASHKIFILPGWNSVI